MKVIINMTNKETEQKMFLSSNNKYAAVLKMKRIFGKELSSIKFENGERWNNENGFYRAC